MNGWKEIAAHFGKSVRSVQRWERELGLPVHRLHTAGGEIVFARRSELEKWESCVAEFQKVETIENGRNDVMPDTQIPVGIPPANGPVEIRESGESPKAGTRAYGPRGLIGLGVALVLAVVAFGVWRSGLLGRADRQPTSYKISDDTLKVFNQRGEQLWQHRFPALLHADAYTTTRSLLEMRFMAFEDLDRDGDKELILVTWGDPQFARRLVGFNVDGGQRFALQPGEARTYGGKLESPPYFVTGFELTTEPDGSKTIWAVSVHNYEFPSVLWKLDPHGNVRSEYWSNGHINVVQEGRLNGRRVMFVGAMNNERMAASLAVLDYENPSGSAPAENPKYRCGDCPQGSPLAFFVFPPTEMSREFATRPTVTEIRAQPDGRVTATVVHSRHELQDELGPLGADVWYTLGEHLQLVEAETGDAYRRLHSSVDLVGRLKHPYGPKCEGQIFPVLAWNGKSFTPLPRPHQEKNQAPRIMAQAQK
ncbi:MAG: hypothetical protein M1453_09435 [Acidobacteria bacterium]|nr:hypothetical protein [Acidobacteriota bacterium]MCL5288199.1 hypothetical protein [Acidobacteriota bacterium]